MNFDQQIRLGFSGSLINLGKVPISEGDIKIASTYVGSYHVLELGRHYKEYSKSVASFAKFALLSDVPVADSIGQTLGKSRAAGITGNIGEVVSAIVANRTLGFETSGIAHLKIIGNMKTPDYLLRTSEKYSNLLESIGIVSDSDVRSFPKWWLMESKAVASGKITTKPKPAFLQLALFWYRMRNEYQEGVGYGLVTSTGLNPRKIVQNVFLPTNQSNLLKFLDGFKSEKDFRKELEDGVDSTLAFFKS